VSALALCAGCWHINCLPALFFCQQTCIQLFIMSNSCYLLRNLLTNLYGLVWNISAGYVLLNLRPYLLHNGCLAHGSIKNRTRHSLLRATIWTSDHVDVIVVFYPNLDYVQKSPILSFTKFRSVGA
jgi:hypothetical protein